MVYFIGLKIHSVLLVPRFTAEEKQIWWPSTPRLTTVPRGHMLMLPGPLIQLVWGAAWTLGFFKVSRVILVCSLVKNQCSRQFFSNCNIHKKSPGNLTNKQIQVKSLRFCIYNTLPGGAGAAGPLAELLSLPSFLRFIC